MDAGNIISLITGVLGVAGAIGGIVTWLSTQNNKRIADSITKALTPLTYEMKSLNSHLEVNIIEHKEFKGMLDEHDDRLNDHDKRIYLLEKFGGENK